MLLGTRCRRLTSTCGRCCSSSSALGKTRLHFYLEAFSGAAAAHSEEAKAMAVQSRNVSESVDGNAKVLAAMRRALRHHGNRSSVLAAVRTFIDLNAYNIAATVRTEKSLAEALDGRERARLRPHQAAISSP